MKSTAEKIRELEQEYWHQVNTLNVMESCPRYTEEQRQEVREKMAVAQEELARLCAKK